MFSTDSLDWLAGKAMGEANLKIAGIHCPWTSLNLVLQGDPRLDGSEIVDLLPFRSFLRQIKIKWRLKNGSGFRVDSCKAATSEHKTGLTRTCPKPLTCRIWRDLVEQIKSWPTNNNTHIYIIYYNIYNTQKSYHSQNTSDYCRYS